MESQNSSLICAGVIAPVALEHQPFALHPGGAALRAERNKDLPVGASCAKGLRHVGCGDQLDPPSVSVLGALAMLLIHVLVAG